MTKNGPTPKRVPDSKHLKALMDVEQPIIVDLEWDPENPQMVNSCSGHSEKHTTDCDGECKMREIDEWDVKIENENRAWFRMGAAPNQEVLRKEIQIQTIIKIILDKLDMSEDDFNAIFKPLMLELMQTVRAANEAEMKSAQLRSKIHLPGGPLQ